MEKEINQEEDKRCKIYFPIEVIAVPRKIKSFDYYDTFPKRFRELLDSRKDITQEGIAELVGVTRQTVGNWYSGKSAPDAVSLAKIADEFNVSIDWLLRENAPKKMDAKLSAICEYTGLSEKAITALHEKACNQLSRLPSHKKESGVLSEFIANAVGFPGIDFLSKAVGAIENYTKAVKKLESVQRSEDVKVTIDAMFEAADIYNEYQVEMFWVQKSVTQWLEELTIKKAGNAVYKLLSSQVSLKVQEGLTKNQKAGEEVGEHPETDE